MHRDRSHGKTNLLSKAPSTHGEIRERVLPRFPCVPRIPSESGGSIHRRVRCRRKRRTCPLTRLSGSPLLVKPPCSVGLYFSCPAWDWPLCSPPTWAADLLGSASDRIREPSRTKRAKGRNAPSFEGTLEAWCEPWASSSVLAAWASDSFDQRQQSDRRDERRPASCPVSTHLATKALVRLSRLGKSFAAGQEVGRSVLRRAPGRRARSRASAGPTTHPDDIVADKSWL